jgi:Tfp pilus assembly protein PilV
MDRSGNGRAGGKLSASVPLSGVALIEVLVAVSVIGVGMGAVFQGLSTAARLQSRLDERSDGRRLAAALVSRLEAGGGPEGDQEGRFDPPDDRYSWSATVRRPEGDTPFSLLEVRVTRAEVDVHAYTLRTLLPQR